MSTRAPSRRRQRGAALLVLLTILTLGAAAVIISGWRGASAAAGERQALAALGQAREALLGYAALHGRLPRPAPAADRGLESGASCASEQQCTGFLPWATLGLGPQYARGKPLRYSVTPAFSANGARLTQAIPTKTISTRDDEQLLDLRGHGECAARDACVPAVLLASGKYQGLDDGDQAINDEATRHFIQRPASDLERGPGGPFDDLLVWLPTDLVIKRSTAAHTIR